MDYKRGKNDKNWPKSEDHQTRLEKLQNKSAATIYTFKGKFEGDTELTTPQIVCTVANTDRARAIFEAMSCFVGPVDTKNEGTTLWLRNPEFNVATCDQTVKGLLLDTPNNVLSKFWATKTACDLSIADRKNPMVPPDYALAALSFSNPTRPEIVPDSGIQILFKVSESDRESLVLFPAICSVDTFTGSDLGYTHGQGAAEGAGQTYTPIAGGARFVQVDNIESVKQPQQ